MAFKVGSVLTSQDVVKVKRMKAEIELLRKRLNEYMENVDPEIVAWEEALENSKRLVAQLQINNDKELKNIDIYLNHSDVDDQPDEEDRRAVEGLEQWTRGNNAALLLVGTYLEVMFSKVGTKREDPDDIPVSFKEDESDGSSSGTDEE